MLRFITSSSTPIPRPTVRGADAGIARSPAAAPGAAASTIRARQARAGATRETGQDQQRADASRPGHGRVRYPNAVPRPRRSADVGRFRAETRAVAARAGCPRPRRCSVPVSATSRVDSGGRAAGHTGGPWTSGSARPATTTRSGRGSFYPADLPAAKMLPYYAEPLPDGRDQLHVLPDADRQGARRLAGGDAGHASASRSRRRSGSPTTARLKDVGDLVRGFCDLAAGARARGWPRCCSSCRRT